MSVLWHRMAGLEAVEVISRGIDEAIWRVYQYKTQRCIMQNSWAYELYFTAPLASQPLVSFPLFWASFPQILASFSLEGNHRHHRSRRPHPAHASHLLTMKE